MEGTQETLISVTGSRKICPEALSETDRPSDEHQEAQFYTGTSFHTHIWEPPQGSPSPAPRSPSPLPAGAPPREEEENSGPSVQGFLGRKRRGALESQGYKGACRPGCPTILWWVIPSIWRMKASGLNHPKRRETPHPHPGYSNKR